MQKPLSKLADIHYGKSPADVMEDDGPFPLMGTGGEYGRANRANFKSGIVVPRKGSLGSPHLVVGSFWASDTTYAVIPKEDVDARWLYYNLLNFDLTRLNEATGVPSISREWLSKIKFSDPGPGRREKVADVLEAADQAIEKTEALIEKYQQIKAGLMHDLFTRGIGADGKLRPPREQAPELYQETPFGWIPNAWDVCRLSSEISISHGHAFPGAGFFDEPPGEVLLTPGNFHRDGGLYFGSSNTQYFRGEIPPDTVLEGGQLVVVMTDLSPQTLILGRFAKVGNQFPVLHNQRIGLVKQKSVGRWDDGYLSFALNDERIRREIIIGATGTTVRHTSPTKILSLFIGKPSKHEQEHCAANLNSIECKLHVEMLTLEKLIGIKRGLMSDLLGARVGLENV